MGEIEKTIEEFNKLASQLRSQVKNGYLMLVDLVGSTAFKTRHPENVWLDRLIAFYETVKSSLPQGHTKYLGDGILIFFEDKTIDSTALIEKAKEILYNLSQLNNTNKFLGDYAIVVRIILNAGSVYMFPDEDVQGTAVDKLFRLEKFVPDGHIGMTEEFVSCAGLTGLTPIGHFFLKGLAVGRHPLYIETNYNGYDSTKVKDLMAESAAASLWWISGSSNKPVFIVDGYIPPEERSSAVIQIGDKSAVLQAFYNLALAGGIRNVYHYASPQFPLEKITENIVCIGGPCYNSVTERLMNEANLPVRFEGLADEDDKTPLVHHESGDKFEKSYDPMNRLVHDCGLFARFTNPYNEKSKIIIACGIESPAVEGIVNVFSPMTNPLFLKLYEHLINESFKKTGSKDLFSFCCVIPFDIEVATGSARLPTLDAQKRYVFGIT